MSTEAKELVRKARYLSADDLLAEAEKLINETRSERDHWKDNAYDLNRALSASQAQVTSLLAAAKAALTAMEHDCWRRDNVAVNALRDAIQKAEA